MERGMFGPSAQGPRQGDLGSRMLRIILEPSEGGASGACKGWELPSSSQCWEDSLQGSHHLAGSFCSAWEGILSPGAYKLISLVISALGLPQLPAKN